MNKKFALNTTTVQPQRNNSHNMSVKNKKAKEKKTTLKKQPTVN